MMTEQRTLLIFLKSFGFFDFLVLTGIVIFLIGMIFWIIYAFKSFIKRQEKADLMKEKVLPELISKFGKVISIEAANYDRSIRFERYGTIFDVKVTAISTEKVRNIIQFSLPNLREEFYIQHRDFFLFKNPSGCPEVKLTMPDDFIFHSKNPQFLANLVAKDTIRNEIYKYQRKVSRQFNIAFENGLFTVDWHRGFRDGELTLETGIDQETSQIEGQKLEQLCQTAVVFYDELAKI